VRALPQNALQSLRTAPIKLEYLHGGYICCLTSESNTVPNSKCTGVARFLLFYIYLLEPNSASMNQILKVLKFKTTLSSQNT
jgi:hypothetical protein